MTDCPEALEDRLRRVLREGPRLRLAALFGSAASGRVHASSDVDIAILPEDESLSLGAGLALQHAPERAAGCRVDLVPLDSADPILRYEVARAGHPLFEQAPGVFAYFAAEAALEFLDLEPTLEDARRTFLAGLAGGQR